MVPISRQASGQARVPASVVSVPNDIHRGYQIRITGCADLDAALNLQEPMARVLCPGEDHPPPCPVPWSMQLTEDDRGQPALRLLLWTTGDTADEIATRVQAHVGQRLTVSVTEGAGNEFDTVAEQHRIEQRREFGHPAPVDR